MKTRREMLKTGLGATLCLLAGGLLSACASKPGGREKGSPWRCEKCGKLFRSHEDLTRKRCPRCFAKRLVRIAEEELEAHLQN